MSRVSASREMLLVALNIADFLSFESNQYMHLVVARINSHSTMRRKEGRVS